MRKCRKKILIGAMIETPAAAWNIKWIAERVDFLSVGGNDLAQFYFAADRDSERVQRRYDPLNPGFLSFLKHTIDGANAASAPLSYCGEQAADPVAAAALIGVGVRQFSVPAPAVGPFRRLIRSINASEISAWMDTQLASPSETIREPLLTYLRDKNASYG